jgi:uncharacterized protein (TIGR02996 family)
MPARASISLPPPRPQVTAFLAEAKEHFDDDAPRLVLADWLEEYGDESDQARAAFVRAQCERAPLEQQGSRAVALRQIESDLLARHQQTWLGPLLVGRCAWSFERGLAHGSVGNFTGLGYYRAEEPSISVVLDALAGSEIAAWVDSLALEYLVEEDARRIADSPFLAEIVSLEVDLCGAGAHLHALIASPHLAGLRRLSLRRPISEDEVVALASAPLPPGLTSLTLALADVRGRGAFALAGSHHLDRLSSLCLSNCPVSSKGEAALRRRFGDRLILTW